MPNVSIVIPTKDRLDMLQRAVRSVQMQTNSSWELIILDDGSTDGTSEWILSQSSKDPRVQYYRNEIPIGSARNIARGLSYGTANYVQILCDDDYLQMDFLQRCLSACEAHPDAGLICGQRIAVYPNSRLNRKYKMSFDGLVPPMATVVRALRSGNLFGLHSSVIIKRSTAVSIGGFQVSNWTSLDFELYLNIASRHPIVFVPGAYAYQTMHRHTETGRVVHSGLLVVHEIHMVNRYLRRYSHLLRQEDVQAAFLRLYSLAWVFLVANLSDKSSRRRMIRCLRVLRPKIRVRFIGILALWTSGHLLYDRWQRQYS